MSDQMNRPPMPGAMGAQTRPNAISQNSSVYNPSDAAMMAQSGKITKDMTVGDLVTKVLKVPLTAPASALVGALKTQLGNRNMAGKAQSMSAGAPPMGAPPSPQGGRPPMGQPPAAAPAAGGGMAELMKQVGGR